MTNDSLKVLCPILSGPCAKFGFYVDCYWNWIPVLCWRYLLIGMFVPRQCWCRQQSFSSTSFRFFYQGSIKTFLYSWTYLHRCFFANVLETGNILTKIFLLIEGALCLIMFEIHHCVYDLFL